MIGLDVVRSRFFFNDTATTEIYTLSLHDALPILSCRPTGRPEAVKPQGTERLGKPVMLVGPVSRVTAERTASLDRKSTRLNSSHANISYAVFCLKKKKIYHNV